MIQTLPASGIPAAAPTPSAIPIVQRIEVPAAGGQNQATGRSETELEELAQALFRRIRTRLRSDLLHDREAKGLTFDHV